MKFFGGQFKAGALFSPITALMEGESPGARLIREMFSPDAKNHPLPPESATLPPAVPQIPYSNGLPVN